VFGTAFLRHVPGLTLLYPRSIEELEHMVRFAHQAEGPVFLRYPRAESEGMKELSCASFRLGVWEQLQPGSQLCLIAMGPMVTEALAVRQMLRKEGVTSRVVNASSIKPLDTAFLQELTTMEMPYYILEEQVLAGGLGSAVSEYCVQNGLKLPEYIFSLPDVFLPHGSHAELLRSCGLDAGSIFRQISSMRKGIA
jgi:1-deoxy-D-xylulose-5-phosphate synthase